MGILDKSFRYVPSHKTDVAATIKREQKRLAEAKQSAQQPVRAVVTKIVQRGGK